MKVNVKGHIRDLLAFRRLIPQRKKRIARSSTKALDMDPVNDLARRLHPDRQALVIADIRDETKTARTFRLVADPDSDTTELAYFRAGAQPEGRGLRRADHAALFHLFRTA
jgi:hypothetical protein